MRASPAGDQMPALFVGARPMPLVCSRAVRSFPLVVTLAVLSACGGGRATRPANRPSPEAPTTPEQQRQNGPGVPDAIRLYRQMGLLAEGGETPFVGSVAFLAGRSADSTLMLLTVSMPSGGLTFAREGERYRASYAVTLELRAQGQASRRFEEREIVRVPSYKETTRVDESVFFRQVLSVAPGTYDLTLSVRDDGGNRSGSVEATLGVPRMATGTLSSPIAFYEVAPRASVDSIPRLVATPRSTATFGQDSVMPIYLEGYGTGERLPIRLSVHGESGGPELWGDTTSLPRRGALFSGAVNVPISHVGVGVVSLVARRLDTQDSTKTPIFVTFGEELPVATFGEMLTYLRYFTSGSRLSQLRDASPETRGAKWSAFLRETDPIPETPQHEGLRDYFLRVAQANARFREEGASGWLSDRGRVFVSLGNPDQIFEPTVAGDQRGRGQVWEYHRYQLRLVFIDQTGFGRWRLTRTSESEFETAWRRDVVKG
jgi:GWxTD domain-containing protein